MRLIVAILAILGKRVSFLQLQDFMLSSSLFSCSCLYVFHSVVMSDVTIVGLLKG